ncbi:MAG: hypothetical protein Q9190_005780 [Brigantiaea leucoxantha]
MAPLSSDKDSGVTGGAKFVTSTVGNTVGGLGRTVGGVVGAGSRGIGQTITGATGSAGKPVGEAIESLGNGVEAGANNVSKGVEDAGKWKTHFLPQNTRDSRFSNPAGKKRGSYWSSRRRSQNDGLYGESSDDEGAETVERKLERLQLEVREIREALESDESSKAKDDDIDGQSTGNLLGTVDSLTRILNEVGTSNKIDHRGAAYRLIQGSRSWQRQGSLSTKTLSNDSERPVESTAPSKNPSIDLDMNHILSKVSDFDKRLATMEIVVGPDSNPLSSQDDSSVVAVLPALKGLERQIATISTATESSIDNMSRQIRQMTQESEKLTESRKNAAVHDPSSRLSTDRSSSMTFRASATNAEEMQATQQVSKINALHGALGTIESLAPLLPSVLDRLRSLRSIHADAALANDALSKAESRQASMVEEIRDWREALVKVEKAFEQGSTAMKEDTGLVEEWVKDLERRMEDFGS